MVALVSVNRSESADFKDRYGGHRRETGKWVIPEP